MKSLGICVGASSIGAVLFEKDGDNKKVVWSSYASHDGNPGEALNKIRAGAQWKDADSVVLTGRKYKDAVNLTSIPESEALEKAFSFNKTKYGNVNFIISAGAETIIAYRMSPDGRIIDVATGNKCASGTGEFFLQQLGRMNIGVEEAIDSATGEKPYKVAGRCSVFCKSDCTHALNKGTAKKNVVAGLCDMMAGKISEIVRKGEEKNLLIVGGLSKNSVMVDFVKEKSNNVYVDENSHIFEALGAAIWGSENKSVSKDIKEIFKEHTSSFPFLPALKDYQHLVRFEEMEKGNAEENDKCILGLDVGSTTTKAVLLRISDDALLAECYLRTNGDPIGASKNCYKEILKQVDKKIKIVGLGVTGSGRQIAGLHAITPSIINEIIAHAKAASHFDKDVDTIFEIGGQDAKYTYIVNGVPADYAMNEACSAGTGSFLEEAAREVLGIETIEIEKIAMKGEKAPNFNDQCSAFISSDIKLAIQEGAKPEEITAGLVYSICMNYVNRVKGNRPYGNKIFMQGGVCYNKAVPIAMASLIGKEIVVPPNPGLMGAFGVALAVKEKIELGLVQEIEFDLKELSERVVEYKDSFECAGGKEKCDRKCKINRIVVNGKTYPFGGACNKYYNIAHAKSEVDSSELDLVRYREYLVFEKFGKEYAFEGNKKGITVGINNSLLVNTLFPLYYNFFKGIGCEVVYSDKITQEGVDKKSASYCYPIEVAHGAMDDLIKKNPDYIFIPHVLGLHVKDDGKASVICPFVQGESYCLSTAFEKKIINPIFDFSKGYEYEKEKFIELGKRFGAGKKESIKAFEHALKAQQGFHFECKRKGEEIIEVIEKNNEIGIVLFGRPYNAFTKNANMGIPAKFASRGYRIIPVDFLPFNGEEIGGNIYWAMGRIIMKSSKIVKKNDNLFGAYITNFSCGPDSFLTNFFRDEMGDKPSLILELDSHTADAGIDTRVEAFLDVIASYIELKKSGKRGLKQSKKSFTKAETITKGGKVFVKTSNGELLPITDSRVKVVIPPMSDLGADTLSASMRYCGLNAVGIKEIGEDELKIGRGKTSCKECLPLTLVVGGLLQYIKNDRKEGEITVYFMPEASGPCRFGVYNMFINSLIEKEKLENVATLSVTCENSYAGLGNKFTIRAWQSIIIEDVLQEIYSAILVMAKDKNAGIKIYENVCNNITESLSSKSWKEIKMVLKKSVEELQKIEVTSEIEDIPKVGINGEIYVRRNSFSRQRIVERLADKGIIAKVAPAAEWFYFVDYLVKNDYVADPKFKDKMWVTVMEFFKNKYEKDIKKIFKKSKFYEMHMVDVEEIMENVKDLVSPAMGGEQVLTVGASITDIIDNVDGVISIGPFGCMPSRISEAILNDKLNDKKKECTTDSELVEKVMSHYPYLPFLAIESDGNPFSQVIEAKFENFCIQVARVKDKIQEEKKRG